MTEHPIMSTEQLRNLELDIGASSSDRVIPMLSIDTRGGRWVLGEDQQVEEPVFLLIEPRYYRELYANDFNDRAPGEKSELVCGSWAHNEAFGHGGRDRSMALERRDCDICPSGAWVKDLQGRNKNLCPEKAEYLAMLRVGDRFSPCFIRVGGQSVKPMREAYEETARRAAIRGVARCFFAVKGAAWEKGNMGTKVPMLTVSKAPITEVEKLAEACEDVVRFVSKHGDRKSEALRLYESRVDAARQRYMRIGLVDADDQPKQAEEVVDAEYEVDSADAAEDEARRAAEEDRLEEDHVRDATKKVEPSKFERDRARRKGKGSKGGLVNLDGEPVPDDTVTIPDDDIPF